MIADKYILEADVVTCSNYRSACDTNDTETAIVMHKRIAGVRMEQADLSIKCEEFDKARLFLEEAKEIIRKLQ